MYYIPLFHKKLMFFKINIDKIYVSNFVHKIPYFFVVLLYINMF